MVSPFACTRINAAAVTKTAACCNASNMNNDFGGIMIWSTHTHTNTHFVHVVWPNVRVGGGLFGHSH